MIDSQFTGWGSYLDLHGRWGESADFLLHTFSHTRVHGVASGKYDIREEIFAQL